MSVCTVAIQVFWLPAGFEGVKRGFRLCYRRNIAENQPVSSQERPAQPLQQGTQMADHRNFDNTAWPPGKQGRLVPRWSGRHRRRHRLHPHHRGRRHHCGRQWPQPLLLQHPVNRLSRASTKHTSGAEQKCTTREVIGQRKCPRQLFGRSVTEAGWQQAGRVSENGFWRDLWVV